MYKKDFWRNRQKGNLFENAIFDCFLINSGMRSGSKAKAALADAIESKVLVNDEEVFSFSPQSARFLIVADELRACGLIKSDADLCRSLHYSPSSFNKVRAEKRNVPIELIVRVCNQFRANPYYILLGEKPILVSSDSVKRDILRVKKKFGDSDSVEEQLKKALSNSTFQDVLKHRFWYDRMLFLARRVAWLEVKNTSLTFEIKTLNKIIAEHLVKK